MHGAKSYKMALPFDEKELPALLADENTGRKAFSAIIAEYSQKLYWHIRKMVLSHDDADDILQNTFVKAWLNIGKFRGDSSLQTWLYRIATNETMNFFNSNYAKYSGNSSDFDDNLAESLKSDPYFDGDEVQLKLQKAVLSLPPKQRIIFNLRYYDEMPYSEMSKVLKTSEGALKASYHHAVKKIEQFMLRPD